MNLGTTRPEAARHFEFAFKGFCSLNILVGANNHAHEDRDSLGVIGIGHCRMRSRRRQKQETVFEVLSIPVLWDGIGFLCQLKIILPFPTC